MGCLVQRWEVSTAEDPNVCYISDPHHAHAAHKDSQRYNPKLADHEQTWTYERVPLDAFQDEVSLTKRWAKPSGFNKHFNGGAKAAHGVHRRGLFKKKDGQARARFFAARYSEVLANPREGGEA